ncbi:hypothetical protein E3Q06_00958 [Wallemia mellicola]|nr:hypothetical protein E3Q24_01196 [Wallemia mellicola]TIB88028.1 hypothetical protein E3Q21_01057 [Wallemia mellicola]TIB90766.1 hypothetical protein E3Q20_01044 [Wallemia mellicola]TIC42651.1 hypothetical protein E3Q07_00954 [Wallemia mellicola]TIC51396.1 hypothetical protein E3Q06_00958 [Wallemia mellicola]
MNEQTRPRACDACRRKKIKCVITEEHSSCSHCSARGDNCTFDHPTPFKRPKQAYVAAIEMRVSKLESLVARLAPPGFDYMKEVGPPITAESFDNNSTKTRKRKQSGDIAKIPVEDDDDASDAELLEVERKIRKCLCINDPVPDLQRYYGPSSTAILFTAAQVYGGQLDDNSKASLLRPKFWQDNERIAEEKMDDDILPILPSDYPTNLDKLVELYFEHVNSYFPLLHKETIIQELQFRKLDRSFAGVIMLICAIASKFSDDPSVLSVDNDSLSAGQKFYKTYKLKCRRNQLAAPSLNDIQSQILLQWYLQSTPFSKASWCINGLTFSYLQDKGYHKKTSSDDYVNDECEEKSSSQSSSVKRRAFYCAFVQDKSLSALLGRSAMMHRHFDVQQPSALPDEVGTSMELSIKYFKEIIKLYSIQDEVLEALYGTKKVSSHFPEDKVKESVAKIAQLNDKLYRWSEDIDLECEHYLLVISSTKLSVVKYNSNCTDDFTHSLMSNLRIAYHILQIFTYRNFITMPRRSTFRSTSLSVATQASINLLNIWYAKAQRNKQHSFVDMLIATSPFVVCLVLVISACECRKYAGETADLLELKYIEIGLRLCREGEKYNYYNGKESDLLIQLLHMCNLHVDVNNLPVVEEYENTSSGSSTFSLDTPPSTEHTQRLYLDLLGSINANVDAPMKEDNSMATVDNLDSILNDYPVTNTVDEQWRSFINALDF